MAKLWRVVKRASRSSPLSRKHATFARVPHTVLTSFGIYFVNSRVFVSGLSSYGGGQFFLTLAHGPGSRGLGAKLDARSGYFSLDLF